MLFLMITFLMIQLQSFSRLFLVLSVVPMGLIGIIAALFISGKPLGFVAILGILALVGMIARTVQGMARVWSGQAWAVRGEA